METKASEELVRSAVVRDRALSPAELEARERVARHTALIQDGVRRGPNAPKSGIFGARA